MKNTSSRLLSTISTCVANFFSQHIIINQGFTWHGVAIKDCSLVYLPEVVHQSHLFVAIFVSPFFVNHPSRAVIWGSGRFNYAVIQQIGKDGFDTHSSNGSDGRDINGIMSLNERQSEALQKKILEVVEYEGVIVFINVGYFCLSCGSVSSILVFVGLGYVTLASLPVSDELRHFLIGISLWLSLSCFLPKPGCRGVFFHRLYFILVHDYAGTPRFGQRLFFSSLPWPCLGTKFGFLFSPFHCFPWNLLLRLLPELMWDLTLKL